MQRVFRGALALLMTMVLVGAMSGCKDEGKPNSNLKIPDVPPGGRDKGDGKGGATKPPG